MKNNRILISLIITTLVFIIVIGVLLVININNTEKEIINNNFVSNNDINNINVEIQENISNEISSDENTLLESKKFSNVEIPSVYYAIKNVSEDFFNTITLAFDEAYAKQYYNDYATYGMEESKEKLIALLGNEYIEANGINKDNIKNYLSKYANNVFKIEKMEESIKDNNICIFKIYGNLNGKVDYNMVIITDENTLKYSIYPYEYIINNDINKININKIEDNVHNSFKYTDINESTIIRNVFSDYIYYVQKNINKAYNKLDLEYRQKRFGNVENFKSYVNKNLKEIGLSSIEKYKKIEYDNYTLYDCVDKNGKHYILKNTEGMEYTVFLDTYTIELNTFKEEYDEANEATKITIQVEKLNQMLNTKDYSAIYNKLNKTFKQNNYSSVSKLEKYLESNIYEINTINIEDYAQQEDYYICKCTLINQKNNQEAKEMNIIIKLIDSNNFELSFSM